MLGHYYLVNSTCDVVNSTSVINNSFFNSLLIPEKFLANHQEITLLVGLSIEG